MAVRYEDVEQIGAWSELALITITPKGGVAFQFASQTETIDIDRGDKDIEVIPNMLGGGIVKLIPETMNTITFEAYEVYSATDNTVEATDSLKGLGQGFMDVRTNWDTTQPVSQAATINRENFRVAILWTDDSAATSAAAATAAATSARRIYFNNCFLVSYKPSFTDGILKHTCIFKNATFQKDGTANVTEESGDDTALPALAAY